VRILSSGLLLKLTFTQERQCPLCQDLVNPVLVVIMAMLVKRCDLEDFFQPPATIESSGHLRDLVDPQDNPVDHERWPTQWGPIQNPIRCPPTEEELGNPADCRQNGEVCQSDTNSPPGCGGADEHYQRVEHRAKQTEQILKEHRTALSLGASQAIPVLPAWSQTLRSFRKERGTSSSTCRSHYPVRIS
jgi:hypothetical protein